MKCILSLLLLVALTTGQPKVFYPKGTGVVELTDANFDKLVVKDEGVWVVEFFTPWCRPCQWLAPEFIKVAKTLKGVVKVGAINDDKYPSIGEKYGVEDFPTIMIFGALKDSPTFYYGGREAADIVKAARAEV